MPLCSQRKACPPPAPVPRLVLPSFDPQSGCDEIRPHEIGSQERQNDPTDNEPDEDDASV